MSDKQIIFFLRNDLNYSKKDIEMFFDISSSTYDKLISPNVEQKLPKKSKMFLCHFLGVNDFDKLDSDEIKTIFLKNENKIKKVIKWKNFLSENKEGYFFERVEILIKFLQISSIKSSDEESLQNIGQLLNDKKFVDIFESTIRIKSFYLNRDSSNLTDEDLSLIAYLVIKNSKSKELLKKNKELISLGNELLEKSKNYFESDEFFLFNEKGDR